MINEYQLKFYSIEHDIEETKVSCDGCTFCCENKSPLLTSKEFESGKYIYTFINNGGLPFVGIPKIDSGCIYLQNKKCTIYEDRPLACRQYDCHKDESKLMKEFVKKREFNDE